MKTVDIKGKPYVEVNERIKYFRKNHKDGAILTEIISLNDGVCVIKASVMIGSDIVATGHAYEKEGSTFINKTSYIENCETSAVGRALGNLGIGIDTSVASYEEVATAIENQKPTPKVTKKQRDVVIATAKRKGISVDHIKDYCKKKFGKSFDIINQVEYTTLLATIQDKPDTKQEEN